ncbi:Membrane dipeptidase [compost metagenome]
MGADTRRRLSLEGDARRRNRSAHGDTVRREPRRAVAGEVRPEAQPTLSDYVDHIDYIAKRIGWRHVGVGTDFDHGAGVAGFDSEAEAPNVTAELLRRGYSEEQVDAIWSGNFLRVLRAAEAARRT